MRSGLREPFAIFRGQRHELANRLRIYKQAHDAAFAGDIPFGAKTAVVRDTFVADSELAARRIAEDACMGSLNFANLRGPRIYLDPGEVLPTDKEAALRKRLTYDFVAPRALFFGSPEEVTERIVSLAENTNIEHLMFKCGWPGVPHEETMRCLARLASEVLPCVRERLARRTPIGAAAE